MNVEVEPQSPDGAAIYVFMNQPHPAAQEDDPRMVYKIDLEVKGQVSANPFTVVEILTKDRVKNFIGDSDVVLTLVPTSGVKFSFQQLFLSLFTKA